MTDAVKRHWPEYLMEACGLPCAKLHHANDRRCIFRCRYARNPS